MNTLEKIEKKNVEKEKKKIWGFRAILNEKGEFRFDVNTNGCNLGQLGVLTILHQKIGIALQKSSKPKDYMSRRYEGEEAEGIQEDIFKDEDYY